MRQGFEDAIQYWTVTITMLCVIGFLMGRVRQQIDWLVDRLETAARTDTLTGLLNRRGFEERFGLGARAGTPRRAADEPPGRRRRPLQGRERSLRPPRGRRGAHAHRQDPLRGESAQIDVVVRMGGEEFALILPDTDQHGAYVLGRADAGRGPATRSRASQCR